MATEQIKWESDINGTLYSFSYVKEKREHLITVNDQTTKLKASFKSLVLGFDEPFAIDGIKARLVITNKKPDVAINGIFLQSKKPYVMTPFWVMFFALPCIVLLIAGGAIGGALAAVGFFSCLAISKRKLPTIVKLVSSIAIVGICWLIYSVIALMLS